MKKSETFLVVPGWDFFEKYMQFKYNLQQIKTRLIAKQSRVPYPNA